MDFHATVLQRNRDQDHDDSSGLAAPRDFSSSSTPGPGVAAGSVNPSPDDHNHNHNYNHYHDQGRHHRPHSHHHDHHRHPSSHSHSHDALSPHTTANSHHHHHRHSSSSDNHYNQHQHHQQQHQRHHSYQQQQKQLLRSPSAGAKSAISSLAAPPGALSSLLSSNSSPVMSTNGARPPSGSPLQPPRSAGHLSPPEGRQSSRDKSSGSFYDPLTDTTRERKNSTESWSHKQSRADTYRSESVHNGHGSASPERAKSSSRHSHSHSHSKNGAEPPSPTNKALNLTSPSRHQANSRQTSTPAPSLPSILNPEPSSAAPTSQTPSRAAELMSFSNILSSAEPLPKPKAALMPEKKEKAPRRSKGRESHIRESEDPTSKESSKKTSRRASSKTNPRDTPTRAPKRQANGLPKAKTLPVEKEKKITQILDKLNADVKDDDLDTMDAERDSYMTRSKRRKLDITKEDHVDNVLRQDYLSEVLCTRLNKRAEQGKDRFKDKNYEVALQEVRERELFAEKERKKDMQRKRRREKSMQVTIEQKEAALARALATEDEHERAKHLREAERAEKKAQQTKLILQRGIKGPARNLPQTELPLVLETGTVSSFSVGDGEPGSTTKSKRKSTGNRLKKSKEQKQAEKDSAEAAQRALDAGEELPSVEQTKIRIKLNKGSNKDTKDKDKDEVEVSGEEARKPTRKEKKKEAKEKAKAAAAAAAAAEEPPADPLETKFQSKGYNQIYDQIWRDLARKDVPKTYKLASDSYATKASNLKKTAILASKEAKRWQLRTNKGTKDLQARAKRCMRDMMSFWKRNEREERDLRKAAEKQEIENARKEEAEREAARQKRKLNFLISQTELYSHFIGKKIKTDEVERSTDNPEIAGDAKPAATEDKPEGVTEPTGEAGTRVTDFDQLDFDEGNEEALQAAAVANAQSAIAEAQAKARAFNQTDTDMDEDGEMNFQNPTGMGEATIEQPKLLNCQLKEYQIKGLNWLANLYEQGINGILADEMGLGKTVQSISVMAYLAEVHDIWGPYMVVAPASTLHNWQQEIAKFVPQFKVLPYWGTGPDRKVLRKFWDRKHNTYRKDAPFHVLVTSYQLVVSDVAYFQKMRWQYMILDEAQAIKSSNSSRWKALLGFHCRNRLLLTGTPIQNNMQELWALLHFIMPSLFDSHDEFSEWFSKDIESHAQSNTSLNEDQLKRLHMILKPFMLRRVKKHVQKELGDKIELDVYCDLTYRQRAIYKNLRNQVSIMDLIEKATMGDDQDSGQLMNLLMQFRKVCNHPDLFERAETTSPFFAGYFAETASFVREGNNVPVGYSSRNLVDYSLPRRIWQDGGRLYKAGQDNEQAGFRNRHLNHLMNIWSADNVSDSMAGNDSFSFLRFADTSPAEVAVAGKQDLFTRASALAQKNNRLGHMNVIYDEPGEEKYTPAHALFQIKDRSSRQPLAEVATEGILGSLMNISRMKLKDSSLTRLEQAARPGASAPPIQVSCVGTRGAVHEQENLLFNISMRKSLYGPSDLEETALVSQKVPIERYPPPALLPKPDSEKQRFTNISVPSMRTFVTDSGKLAKLDQLLFKMKEEGHRVLLYFQMTRMIDLMEEYLTYRNYKYCRLDGSTKLEDRRDTVHDFQTRPEIFVFLLSTRAGGLGINLTSADTVIFYDSDWNPTIDSQAMDRAHRLGQTKQVTVYRLITRNTIEERIRKRAQQKEEVQRVVISGGGAKGVDFSGRKPADNRNRDIAMWLADDEQAEMIEQREKELLESGELEKGTKKRGGGKRKREAASLDEMYHEGEGNFDDGSKDKPSGTVTPAEPETKATKKPRKSGGKKAKTAKQRLALVDGGGD